MVEMPKIKVKALGQLFFTFYATFIFGGILTMVTAGSYLALRPIEMLSFRSDDNWCDLVTSGIGNHCFGDYQLPSQLVTDVNPWILGHSYPPFSMLIHLIFAWLKSSFLGPQGSLLLYLLLLIVALTFPIYKSLEKMPKSFRLPTALILSVFSTAGLNNFDRGSSAAFATPFLYLAARDYLNNNPNKVLLWTSLAALIRPQFILLSIFLISIRAYKQLIASISILAGSIFIGFALWPGDRILHFRSWLEMLTSYDQYAPSQFNWPINISAGKSLSRILTYFDQKFPSYEIFSSLNTWALNNFKNIGIIFAYLVLIVAGFFGSKISKSIVVVLVLSAPSLVPGVSWAYYLLFLIPITALIISTGIDSKGLLDLDQKLNPMSKIHISLTISLVLSPFVLPRMENPSKVAASDPDFIGKITQIQGPLILILTISLITVGFFQVSHSAAQKWAIFAKNPSNPV